MKIKFENNVKVFYDITHRDLVDAGLRAQVCNRAEHVLKIATYLKKVRKTTRTTVIKKHYPIDNTWYDKQGRKHTSTKKVLTVVDNPEKPYAYKPYTYKAIAESLYGDYYVVTTKGLVTIRECLDTLRIFERKGNWDKHASLKKKVDARLDEISRGRAYTLTQALYTPEYKIKRLETFVPNNDGYVEYPQTLSKLAINYSIDALCADGIELSPSISPVVYYYQKKLGQYNHITGCVEEQPHTSVSNSTMRVDLHTKRYASSGYRKLLELGDVFGVQPHFKWQDVKTVDGTDSVEVLGVNKSAMDEFEVTVNWYVGQAELGNDFSDPIELHHIDGVHVKQTTRYEYYKHREEWDDWKEVECRDFQVEIEGKLDEYEKQADILDDHQ